jgi:glycosyltransferase involved in cell wall biosynthesis
LRAVKDPLLAARAARLVRADSRLVVEHVGDSLDAAFAADALRENASAGRWRWLGPRSRLATLRAIASAHLLVLPSRSEGGPGVLAEAVMASTPILATRTEGAVGMLGSDHPGLFEPGDAPALARLLERAEFEPDFLRQLTAAGDARRPLFERAREVAAWRDLLVWLGLSPTAGRRS